MKKKLLLILSIIGILGFSMTVYAADDPLIPDTPVNKSCYKCGDTLKWMEDGSASSECVKDDKITEESKCVVNPDTGIKDYALTILGVITLASVSYYAVSKSSMFR